VIRRIPHIKALGVFADFCWPAALPEFKQYNLIYGWNYSGKTTLSRAFRSFEQKQPHIDFAGALVQLEADDGTCHDLSAPESAPAFRVFNTDFVRENLSFDVGRATPILVLGAEDIAKQDALKSKQSERQFIALSKETDEHKRQDRVSAIEKALTSYARDLIKNPLAVPNYDKTRFEPKVVACSADPGRYLLDDETLRHAHAVFRSTDKKPTLSAKVVSLSSVAEAQEKLAALLGGVVTANIPIPRLQEHPAVERWVNEGRPLHDSRDTCQFCGQSLPPDLMTQLAGHFSADYDNLMADLSALAKTIQAAKEETVSLDHKADFYPELSERFAAEQQQLDRLLTARKSALDTLANALIAKTAKAFTCLECPAVDDPALQIVAAVDAINRTISEHNNRTAEFDKMRQEAFAKLEVHYAASFVRDQKYNEQREEIAALALKVSAQTRTLDDLDAECRVLERALSEASKGADRINNLIRACFGKDDLRVVVSADERFEIARGGVIAKNLSEGEQTAIAFAYFITRVQDGRTPLADTIVVIDDPVSSLDANHLFNTFALIKTQLASCRQLFILTHSFEFFNLIRDWALEAEKNEKRLADFKKWGVFLVRRTDSGNAGLEAIPQELLRFRSEYHYLFATLYQFDKAGSDDFDRLLSLPNVVRRFMEAFAGIMIPASAGLRPKMHRLFSDEVERERVWKFMNYYSHNTTIMRSLTIPDVSECKAVVHACLNLLSALH